MGQSSICYPNYLRRYSNNLLEEGQNLLLLVSLLQVKYQTNMYFIITSSEVISSLIKRALALIRRTKHSHNGCRKLGKSHQPFTANLTICSSMLLFVNNRYPVPRTEYNA